jgi:hypothetical protein
LARMESRFYLKVNTKKLIDIYGQGGGKIMSYEEMILQRQETETDDCKQCPHKGAICCNQCERITTGRPLEEIYPQLFKK